MVRAIIVEDVHDNINTLKYLLEESPFEFEIVAVADNLEDARRILQLTNIDVAFLDIQLKNGIIFDVLDELKNSIGFDFEIVFITAFSNFEMAIKAIQFACLDYITKPIQQSRLNQVLAKIADQKFAGIQNQQLGILLEAVKGNFSFPKSISVTRTKGIIEIVDIDEIHYFKADKNTCILYLANKQKLHSIKTFAYYLDLFNNHPDFIQISRSHFVNKNKVKRYNHRTKELLLQSGEKLVVSHRMSNMVKEALSNPNSAFGALKEIFGFFSRK